MKYEVVVIINGREADYDFAIGMMDDDIREQLHSLLAPCEAQTFVDAYIVAHYKKFDETFTL